MKILFLAFVFTLLSGFDFPQKPTWKPAGYTELSEFQKKLIDGMEPLSDKNKSFVQLLFEMSKFTNCGVGTALTPTGIYIAIQDRITKDKSSYVMKMKESLLNTYPIRYENKHIHVLVFDQPGKEKDVLTETFFVFFYVATDGSGVEEIQIGSLKNTLNKNIVTQFFTKILVQESETMISCRAK